jgi:hypothetical protein
MNAVKITTVCIEILKEIMVRAIKMSMCLRQGYPISAVLFHICISEDVQLWCTTNPSPPKEIRISGEQEITRLIYPVHIHC